MLPYAQKNRDYGPRHEFNPMAGNCHQAPVVEQVELDGGAVLNA